MIKVLKHIGGGKSTYISLQEYLEEYCKEIPEGWAGISDWIDRVFNIQTETELKALASELQVEYFDVSKIKESYIKLKKEQTIFDDDILKFMSFLLGTNYFIKIGNPSFDTWLNAVDINHPLKSKKELGYGFSFLDAAKYNFGQNTIRKDLLSTIRWISSQGGS